MRMIKDIIQIGDKKLTQTSEPIDLGSISSGKIQELATNLIDTLKHHTKVAAGLSAVQIGILQQMYVVKRMDLPEDREEEIEVMINPKIKIKNEDKTIEWEGCMSISSDNMRLFGPVPRPSEVIVEYYDREANKKKLRAKDFFAHLIQHEQDHLNGILFLQYVQNPKNIWKESELDTYLDQYKKFPPVQ